jgi:hypothetical protein
MERLKWIITLLLALFMSYTSWAQKQTLTGQVILSGGEESHNPLPYASISVLLLPDSTFIKGGVTNEQGKFQLDFTRKPQQTYLLKASYMGCESKFYTLPGDKDTYNVGTIKMKNASIHLKEVVVTAPLQPSEQKGDTTIFNADAFPTPEGAYLEALVKRIPGLSYDAKEKKLSYNGYSINEITVNGKEFFKGNNRVALENLPASFISQLKVYDKASEEEKATGIKSNNKNYVLDLKTKKALNNTLMATAEVGYGTHRKKDINGQLFRFTDKGDNLSLIGNSTNRFHNTPYKGNISNNIGGNISKSFSKDLQVSGNINYSNGRDGGESSSYSEQYLTNSTQYGIASSQSRSRNHNIQGGADVRWNINEKTTVTLSGNLNYGKNRSESMGRNATFTENPQVDLVHPFNHIEKIKKESRINENRQDNQSENRNLSYFLRGSITRQLNEKGNNLSLSVQSSQNQNHSYLYTQAQTTYFRVTDIYGNDSVYRSNQYQESPHTTHEQEIKLAYTHVFSPKIRLQFSYGIGLEKENGEQNTYDFSPLKDYIQGQPLPPDYKRLFVDSLSNQSESKKLKHLLAMQFQYQGKAWGIRASLQMYPQRRTLKQENGQSQIDTMAWSVEWRPSINLTYRKEDNYFVINYSGGTRQPSLSDMLAPTDYSSPLYIRKSNPNLRPLYMQGLNVMFNNFKKGIMVSLMASQQFNSITRATLYNPETGVRETFPVNINGNWNISGNASYDKKIKSFRFFVNGGGNFNRHTSLINEEGNRDMKQSVTHASGIYSQIHFSYLPKWGNIDLSGNWNFQQSKNLLNQSNTYTRMYTVNSYISINLPWHIQFDTDAAYNIRSGTGIEGDSENELLWNMKLIYKFLKEKRAELSFYWADILSQKKDFQRYASATAFSEKYEKQLQGYFMISLKYKLNTLN